ncbi:MAG TPA: thiamine ABC transporter substrate-binding protein [Beutenbergiaceae bacterium]|nr:thiamine ABC transporter substrate-binding protein [Beutenbergiaceae bacterium]
MTSKRQSGGGPSSGGLSGSRRPVATTAAATALILAGCSAGGGGPAPTDQPDSDRATGPVHVVTHDSFALSDELLEAFQAETGHELQFSAPGDGGALVNQLVLTKDSPLGDVVFGVDNSFASRGIVEGVFAEYVSPALPGAAEQYLIDNGHDLTPIDMGDVCLNIDTAWYADEGLDQPQILADLTEPQYADQVVVTNPATSSPGLAFLLATVAEFGEEWTEYWQDLVDNGLLVVDSWSTAYSEEFSGSVGEGPRPIALSYSTSPAFEVGPDGEAPATEAMLSTCFRQVEYAGVLEGAQNPEGAQAFIDFLLTEAVQADIPDQMFMYPVNDDLELPEEWVRWAPLADEPRNLDPAEIDANRQDWIETWTDIVIG